MPSRAPIEIRTRRLLLRPFQATDVEDVLAYRNDAEFVRFLRNAICPFSRQDAEACVAGNMSEPWERSATFAVVLGGTAIGTANLEFEAGKPIAMLGYTVGRAWWGQGIAVEAGLAVMSYGRESCGLARIWASTDARNARSQRVMEKLGMRRETLIRAKGLDRYGEMADEVVYGIGC